MSTTPRRGAVPVGRRVDRARSGGRALLLVGACAVLPWTVPWPWQQDQQSANDPSAIIARAHSQRITGRADHAPLPPSAETMREVSTGVDSARRGYDQPVSASAMAGVRTTPGPYQRLGAIQIPSVGLSAHFGEGVYEQTLLKGPGHWPGTALPGEAGNSVLSGHRNTHTQPFKRLDRLNRGDRVLVRVGRAKPVTFRVTTTTIVPEAKFKAFVLVQPKDPRVRELTMFACHPEGNPIFRIVVRARAEPAGPR